MQIKKHELIVWELWPPLKQKQDRISYRAGLRLN